MPTDWGEVSKFFSELFKDKHMKVAFKIAAYCAALFLVFQLTYFIILTLRGKPTSLFGCSNYSQILVHDTITELKVIHDTTNILKVDSGSLATFKNDAPVFGNQAGRDQTFNNILKEVNFETKDFTATEGQTIFDIPGAPMNVNRFMVLRNGVYLSSKDFRIQKNKLVFTFGLDKGDDITIKWTK